MGVASPTLTAYAQLHGPHHAQLPEKPVQTAIMSLLAPDVHMLLTYFYRVTPASGLLADIVSCKGLGRRASN